MPPVLLVDLNDRIPQRRVHVTAQRTFPGLPGEESGVRHLEHSAHEPDRVASPLRGDIGVLHLDFFVTYEAAVFVKSGSMRRW
jgi:hypothetical protein